ncbi:hypothetical protein FUA48_16090 [Flavobacterium alkalisoli]|uniref:Uncharacterized protein n=1 Tax=Flavobacterium alkalisoli TaxID=2602769 RepID=A0A5B9FXL3_9FLAO|nr:hypothetical protein [Flavobacterium alkalisoli]QEE51041.1 hypothetical protein FUA48_16090 [Flavobacterium alkalisoli]
MTGTNPQETKIEKAAKAVSLCKSPAITPEQRSAFITAYGADKLRILEVPVSDTGAEYYDVVAIVPDRATMSQYMKYIDINPKKAQEILIKQCVKTHLEEVLADDALFMTTVSLVAELIPIRDGRVKKF